MTELEHATLCQACGETLFSNETCESIGCDFYEGRLMIVHERPDGTFRLQSPDGEIERDVSRADGIRILRERGIPESIILDEEGWKTRNPDRLRCVMT